MVLDELEEKARAVLPWFLVPKFRNAVFVFQAVDLDELRARVDDVMYHVVAGRPFIPSTASMLYVDELKYIASGRKQGQGAVVDVKVVGARVVGYRPFDAKRIVYTGRTLPDRYELFSATGSPSPIDIEVVTGDLLRLNAGRFFAGALLPVLEKHGFRVERMHDTRYRVILTLASGDVQARESIEVGLYRFEKDGRGWWAPSIASGVFEYVVETGEPPVDDKAVKKLVEGVWREIVRVGERLLPLSQTLLQSTTRSKFYYVIGEVESGAQDIERVTLASGRVDRGVYASIFARGGRLYLKVSMLPHSPPAVVVLNYPPFNIAPLAAVMREDRMLELAKAAVNEAEARGARVTLYVEEVAEAMRDSEVSVDDVRAALREGYPRLATLRRLLRKLEPLMDYADVLSVTVIRPEAKLDELLLQPVGEKAEREKRGERLVEAE